MKRVSAFSVPGGKYTVFENVLVRERIIVGVCMKVVVCDGVGLVSDICIVNVMLCVSVRDGDWRWVRLFGMDIDGLIV